MLATERVPRTDDSAVGIGEECENTRPKKKRCDNMRLGGNVFAGRVNRFADSIRESDDARIPSSVSGFFPSRSALSGRFKSAKITRDTRRTTG